MKRLHFISVWNTVVTMDKHMHDTAECAGKAAGRPKAADVEARTQELLQVAATLFLKNGYTKTSLESIARAAHVAVRTIYVKFGGKEFDTLYVTSTDKVFSRKLNTKGTPLVAKTAAK